jgi:hypothetical protein
MTYLDVVPNGDGEKNGPREESRERAAVGDLARAKCCCQEFKRPRQS